MNVRTKHRIIGGLVLLALAAIFLPLAFHGSRDISKITVSARIPQLPPEPHVSLELGTPEKALVAKSGVQVAPIAPAKATVAATKKMDVVPKRTRVPEKSVVVASAEKNTKLQPSNSGSVKNNGLSSTVPVTAKQITRPTEQIQPVVQKSHPRQTVSPNVKKALQMAVTPPDAWTLQLASFSNKVNANRLVKQLRQSGIDAYTRTLQVNDAKITRVFVGPEIQKTRLVKTEHRLEKQFGLHGVIRKYEV